MITKTVLAIASHNDPWIVDSCNAHLCYSFSRAKFKWFVEGFTYPYFKNLCSIQKEEGDRAVRRECNFGISSLPFLDGVSFWHWLRLSQIKVNFICFKRKSLSIDATWISKITLKRCPWNKLQLKCYTVILLERVKNKTFCLKWGRKTKTFLSHGIARIKAQKEVQRQVPSYYSIATTTSFICMTITKYYSITRAT